MNIYKHLSTEMLWKIGNIQSDNELVRRKQMNFWAFRRKYFEYYASPLKVLEYCERAGMKDKEVRSY